MLTKMDLDFMAVNGCSTPGCKHDHEQKIFLHGRCHPKARVDASYTKGTGVLVVTCSECHALIADVKVSEP